MDKVILPDRDEKGRFIKGYRKNKTFEEIYGKEKAKEIKKKMSKSTSGENNPFYKKNHSEETKQKLREKSLGKSLEERYGEERAIKISEKQSNGLKRWYKENKGTEKYKKRYENRTKHLVKINCPYCKKDFFDYPSNYRIFCSKKCSTKFNSLGERNPFYNKTHTEEDRLKMKGPRLGFIPWSYIDGRSRTKGPDRYGDDWDKIRYLVYCRDRFTCQHCWSKMNKNNILHVHHKIPFLISFDNSLTNLITLCASCHRREDAKIIKELKLQKKMNYVR